MKRSLAPLLFVGAWAGLLSGFAPVPVPDVARVTGKPLPDVSFEDEAHRQRRLRSLGGQPLIVVPTYTSCHATCPLIASGLKRALLEAALDVRSLEVFVFSFDERNTIADLRAFRRAQKLPASWVIGRLDAEGIHRLTEALDYRTSWQQGEWAHPNALAFVSPDQRVATFLFGTSFRGSEIRRALAVARRSSDFRARAAPWALALGTMGLTFSIVGLTHLIGKARLRARAR